MKKKTCVDWFIDWCLTPTLAIYQLYRVVTCVENPNMRIMSQIVYLSLIDCCLTSNISVMFNTDKQFTEKNNLVCENVTLGYTFDYHRKKYIYMSKIKCIWFDNIY
jgi:hypothetical protein